MQNLDVIANELFNKIRGRFPSVTLGDDQSNVTSEPTAARYFDFDFVSEGRAIGKISISLEDSHLAVVYGKDLMTNENDITKSAWYGFLKELRMFAKKRMMSFDTRDITKSNLNTRDYKFLSKNSSGEQPMSESKLYGTSTRSYQNIGTSRLVLRHSQPVNQEQAAGRSQHVDSIYIESTEGERFKYPFKHINGARAMARHVSEGGKPFDDFGQHITSLSEELYKLRKFKSYMNRSSVMAESLSGYMNVVNERILTVKKTVESLQKQSYYTEAVSSFETTVLEEVPTDVAENWIDQLTIKQFNEDLKDVFPYIYKLVSEATRAEEITPEDMVDESGLQYYTGKKKYGKEGMAALSAAGRDGADEEELGRIKDRYKKTSTKEAGGYSSKDHPQSRDYGTGDPDDDDLPFDADDQPMRDKDKFGNVIKNKAQYLAKKGLRSVTGQSEGSRSQYYHEKLADEVFALDPNLDASGRADAVLSAAAPLMVRDLGPQGANNKLNRDEDFSNDFVSAYDDLQRGQAKLNQGVPEARVKDAMHADAEQLSREQFVSKYGSENAEFWDNIMGELDEAGKTKSGADDPCWTGYKQVGTKKKGSRQVPNCVAREEMELESMFDSLMGQWAEGSEDDIEDTRQLRNAIALAKSQKAIRQAKDGKNAKYYADGTKVTPDETARRAAERKAKKQGAAEGMQQALRKYVPGYAKQQIDKKMDDEKFGRRDVDKDANYYRYKKIQDKIKDKDAAEGNAYAHAVQQAKMNGKKKGDKIDGPAGDQITLEKEQQTPLSEFILSYFDKETGQFPKGETAVLTMIEKDYGDQYIEPSKQFIEQIYQVVEQHREPEESQHMQRMRELAGIR